MIWDKINQSYKLFNVRSLQQMLKNLQAAVYSVNMHVRFFRRSQQCWGVICSSSPQSCVLPSSGQWWFQRLLGSEAPRGHNDQRPSPLYDQTFDFLLTPTCWCVSFHPRFFCGNLMNFDGNDLLPPSGTLPEGAPRVVTTVTGCSTCWFIQAKIISYFPIN